MKPVGWGTDRQDDLKKEADVSQYIVDLPGNDQAFIRAVENPKGKTWSIIRNGKNDGTQFRTAQAALEALEAGG